MLCFQQLAQAAQGPVPQLFHILAGALQFFGDGRCRLVLEEKGADHVFLVGQQLAHSFRCGIVQFLCQQFRFRFFRLMKIWHNIPWALIFIASMIAVGIGFWYYYLPVIIVAGIIAFVSGVIVANHFIGNIEKAVDEGRD